ncbi:MAG: hypothetical protein MUF42_13290 [Cytophagaceae bacterium]|jgi:hypothetical protein|nr:hypothetical protein [Cytophagaceae bacterium]
MKYFLSFFIFCNTLLVAQKNYLTLQPNYHHWADRLEIMSGRLHQELHTSVKPYNRQAYSDFLDSVRYALKSRTDSATYAYLRNETWDCHGDSSVYGKPVLRYFFRQKPDVYSVHTDHFDLHVNPVLYFTGGKELNKEAISLNSRGAEVRGTIDGKVGFYTFFTDNQALLPDYVRAYQSQTKAVPGEGFNKLFKTRGVDFISARGYIHLNITKHIDMQFGHDRHFVGNGYRSLIVSDFASPYTFLKLNTQIWKLRYTNLFAEMTANYTGADGLYPKKYMAMHHLSVNIGKHLNIGIFESVMLRGRSKDSLKAGQFDIAYLNPIIFYRSIEQQIGSFDNAILGMDWKLNFLRRFSCYGQVVLDEFVLKEIRARSGWWANKQGLQAGLKYMNVAGIKNLDIQGELNYVRPYMYAHKDYYRNFTHFNQELAHPLGANFTEWIGILRYQPHYRVQCTGKVFLMTKGLDEIDSLNWGGDIRKDYTQIEQQYNNRMAQGLRTQTQLLSLQVSYMLFHNCFVDVFATMRRRNAPVPAFTQNNPIAGLSLRWNIAPRLHEF